MMAVMLSSMGTVAVICVVMVAGMLHSAAGVCEVWETVPANRHMCYFVQGEEEVEVMRDVLQKKWVLEEPDNCKSPFPCFGIVREVVEVEKIPVTVRVCQLEPLWRQPRPIRETYDGVTLILSPGYFRERNFSSQLMCVWNITCAENEALFVNYTDNNLGVQVPESFDNPECDGEYVMVEWKEGRELRCAGHLGPWLHNQIFPHNLKVVFRSQTTGIFGRGLRLDMACYAPTHLDVSPYANCSSLHHIPSQSHEAPELNSAEENQLNQIFSLHLELHMLMSACSRSVQECGDYYSHHINPSILRDLEEAAGGSNTCSPLIHSIKTRTLSMYGF